jgi:two-component system CheB/CheR fusion protein
VPGRGKSPLRELTERKLLDQYAPAAVLVDERGEILYVHGHTGKYLEPAPGEAGMNIVNMAREGLRRALTNTLQKAVAQKEPAHEPGLQVRTNGDFTTVDLTVEPLAAGNAAAAAKLFLVTFADALPAEPQPSAEKATADLVRASLPSEDGDARVAQLRQELRAKEEHLQATNEKLETTNEELKSSNEEMQSVNEELRSTNEELETAKEELQSVNEELATVNAELQQKVADLSRANNDMNNLLAGTGIGTIFVDHQLRILRFTPSVTQVINLILTDVGRPVSHIVSNLVGYDRLVEDVQAVLNDLIPKEVEVQTKAGTWFALRIRPYRTLENVIEGAVITFVDITQRKQ